MIELVARRVMQEERETRQGLAQTSNPLLHLMHGRPGVGKSFVLKKIRECFEQVMGWGIGLEFSYAALQAVMAVSIGGETLQHVAGINPFTCLGSTTKEHQRMSAETLAKRLLQLRWLITDEISMVSANLLAQVDMKLRDAIREQGTQKLFPDGKVRLFGGLNVLFSGEFCQLDPPDGIAISTVPKVFLPLRRDVASSGTAAHGHQVFWGDPPLNVSGMTELTEPHRCQDVWYNECLEECRAMRLSLDNYNFIHGNETTVPGSWLGGVARCGNAKCAALKAKWAEQKRAGVPVDQRQKGCRICRKERLSRCRVATDDTHRDCRKA